MKKRETVEDVHRQLEEKAKKRDELGYCPFGFVKDLAAQFEIEEPELITEMHKRLNGAAEIYEIYRAGMDGRPKRSEIRSEISSVTKLVTKLIERIENLSPQADRIFWRNDGAPFSLFGELVEGAQSRFGHTLTKIMLPDGEEGFTVLHEEHLRESLHILKGYSEDALENLPPQRRGAVKDDALRMWVVNVRGIWEETLQRKFTLDYSKGEALTNAGGFCLAAIQHIDPDIPESKMISAMRKVIKSKRSLRRQLAK